MPVKLSDLAKQTGARLEGDGDCLIERISEISNAVTGDIAFVYNPKYKGFLKETNASAVILKSNLLDACRVSSLVTDDPRLVYAKVANILYPPATMQPGIAETAVIADDANVDKAACIAAGAVVLSSAVIKAGAQIGASSVIEEGAVIGANTVIKPNVTIGYGCTVGDDCILHSGIVIGADGFGFVKDGETYLKIPQLRCVHIGNNVEIGANTTIDRGALEDTIIGNGVKLDNQIQIGHSVTIGDNTVISGGTAIAGSTHIGSSCLIGGLVGIIDHLTIADNVVLTARTMVTRSLPETGSYSSGVAIDTTDNWRKNSLRFRQLDSMAKRIARLEKALKKNTD
jgi:UDP-3-O-[3-hydroxymyristoyl] glucosamine N-acyltransferase